MLFLLTCFPARQRKIRLKSRLFTPLYHQKFILSWMLRLTLCISSQNMGGSIQLAFCPIVDLSPALCVFSITFPSRLVFSPAPTKLHRGNQSHPLEVMVMVFSHLFSGHGTIISVVLDGHQKIRRLENEKKGGSYES